MGHSLYLRVVYRMTVSTTPTKATAVSTSSTKKAALTIDLVLEAKCIDDIRYTAAALPTLAKSGHPGAPIGAAPVAHVIWSHFLKYDPEDSDFAARDRFVLSMGHASALQYTMMHLGTNFMQMSDLQAFRSLNSITPGHPEAGHATKGIEVTTGPLGLGISQAVGLALGQHHYFQRYGAAFDNYTYCMVGDGCLQEGVHAEACSLAGTLGLGRLICVYDSNGITIDGPTSLSFTENVALRFESYGFEVHTVTNGDSDIQGIIDAIAKAKGELTKPSMIIVTSTIGLRSKLEGTNKVHGSPISGDELTAIRKQLGMPEGLTDIRKETYDFYASVKRNAKEQCAEARKAINDLPADLKEELETRKAPTEAQIKTFVSGCEKYDSSAKADSTRNLSGHVLNVAAKIFPGIIGGSADLTGSNMTQLKDEPDIKAGEWKNRYIRFGVREHAMQAVTNGLRAHGGFQPFCSTFLEFVTFAFPALRLAALSNLPTLFIATHDSIELGEDGPTHQAVEVIPLLRATPNIHCWRPCDGKETVATYVDFLSSKKTPVVGCFSRGAILPLDETSVEKAAKGVYELKKVGSGKTKVVLAASGTEVQVIVKAAEIIAKEDCTVSVVSMPCFDLFEEQTEEYKRTIFPKDQLCASVEASMINGLERYVCREASTHMEGYGASAPSKVLMDHFGFTPEKVAKKFIVQLNVNRK